MGESSQIDYQSLSDQDLRLAVAEARGWKQVRETMTNPTRNGQTFTSVVTCWRNPGNEIDGDSPPFWTTDIGAAWELWLELKLPSLQALEDGRTRVWFHPVRGWYAAFVDALTAPRAITLAWMIAWRKDDENDERK